MSRLPDDPRSASVDEVLLAWPTGTPPQKGSSDVPAAGVVAAAGTVGGGTGDGIGDRGKRGSSSSVWEALSTMAARRCCSTSSRKACWTPRWMAPSSLLLCRRPPPRPILRGISPLSLLELRPLEVLLLEDRHSPPSPWLPNCCLRARSAISLKEEQDSHHHSPRDPETPSGNA